MHGRRFSGDREACRRTALTEPAAVITPLSTPTASTGHKDVSVAHSVFDHATPETKAVAVSILDTFLACGRAPRRTVPSPTLSSIAIARQESPRSRSGNVVDVHADPLPSKRCAPITSLGSEPASFLQLVLAEVKASLHALPDQFLFELCHRPDKLSREAGTGVSPYNGLAIVFSDAMPRNPNHLQSYSPTKTYPM